MNEHIVILQLFNKYGVNKTLQILKKDLLSV